MRKKLGGLVSDECRNSWKLFARSRGVTVTGLLEAMGRHLADMDQPEARLPPLLRQAIAEAREIDDDRRQR